MSGEEVVSKEEKENLVLEMKARDFIWWYKFLEENGIDEISTAPWVMSLEEEEEEEEKEEEEEEEEVEEEEDDIIKEIIKDIIEIIITIHIDENHIFKNPSMH